MAPCSEGGRETSFFSRPGLHTSTQHWYFLQAPFIVLHQVMIFEVSPELGIEWLLCCSSSSSTQELILRECPSQAMSLLNRNGCTAVAHGAACPFHRAAPISSDIFDKCGLPCVAWCNKCSREVQCQRPLPPTFVVHIVVVSPMFCVRQGPRPGSSETMCQRGRVSVSRIYKPVAALHGLLYEYEIVEGISSARRWRRSLTQRERRSASCVGNPTGMQNAPSKSILTHRSHIKGLSGLELSFPYPANQK